MDISSAYTLTDPATGNLSLKLFSFENNNHFDHIQHNNYYSVIWLHQGSGKLKSDFSSYDFDDNNLLAFAPYQPFMLCASSQLSGVALQFHPDFFCIHMHHKEVSCNGVLFNNIYQAPYVKVDDSSAVTFRMIIEQMKMEMRQKELAQYDALISYLKIFLVTASRLKIQQQEALNALSESQYKEPLVLQHLKDAIENNYKIKHSAGDYAALLNISTKALGRIAKIHFNKTITHLIAERIIVEAKRELYMTNKSVKEIAYELGYEDEFYFSRFFKTNTDISPQMFRNTVGFGRDLVL
ncbi:helix-turn-helix domain-containing protein [Chitinophaga sp. 22321]|uniref:Helix-turn-helix domain-containing protein n=1 Tax=Chitinophaga hostae TaxID=2831022 RepID=A0ABS5ISS0_9BACT|nr:helix-turn-helix domain-containing protein [Chitinophaga hostae]MBS0026015.1 helix-turn-helix domain-containing protein [Chitinophaga hostae]